MNQQEKTCQLALSLIRGVGFLLWKKFIGRFGSAYALYHEAAHTLRQVGKRNYQPIIQSILAKDTLLRAEEILRDHASKNIQVLSFFDEAYPWRLRHITNPPCFLYTRGKMELASPRVVSIVGTRKATAYGRQTVATLIDGLSAYEVLVVSGLAYGIDIHAHQLALQYGLSTVGVLAGGLDKIYPAAHYPIACDMLAHGGLVGEVPAGSSLENFQFPTRNRLIAGLADATIVVEAGHRSGAIITANFANDYNKEVFAVPGNIGEPFSEGCNQLIRTQQAHLITSAEEVAYMMGWERAESGQAAVLQQPGALLLPSLDPAEEAVVHVLRLAQKALHVDELSQHTHLATERLAPILLQLELRSIVQGLPGSKFKLVGA